MRGISAVDLRQMRLKEVLDTIKSAKKQEKEINTEKFILEIQMKYGLTESKATEYLSTAMKMYDWEVKK